MAADNLLEALLRLNCSAVRVGHPAATRESLRNSTLDAWALRLGGDEYVRLRPDERDALRRKLAARPQASVELNALRAEVQAARDETVRARTDLAAGGDVRGRLAAAEDRAGTLASLNAGLVRKCERLLGAPQGGSL